MPTLPFPPLMIGPLGMQEMLIIMVVALIVFGPRKLPQIGKTLGKSLAEFRRTSTELRNTLEREVEMEEFRSAREEVSGLGRDLRGGLDPAGGAPPPGRRDSGNSGAEEPQVGESAAPREARDPPPNEESPPGGETAAPADEDAGPSGPSGHSGPAGPSSGEGAAPGAAEAAGSAAAGPSEASPAPNGAPEAAPEGAPERESDPNAAGG